MKIFKQNRKLKYKHLLLKEKELSENFSKLRQIEIPEDKDEANKLEEAKRLVYTRWVIITDLLTVMDKKDDTKKNERELNRVIKIMGVED